MSRKINQAKLLAKIAAVTGAPLEELQKVKTLYSFEESVYEAQSVINFYHTRVKPEEPKKATGETDLQFAGRKAAFDNAFNEWRIRLCGSCNLPFAYAYTYEGVKFCSLDCLDDELRKIGLHVTYGRDLKMRWGKWVPAIVPPNVVQIFSEHSEVLAAECDVLLKSDLPKSHPHIRQG